MNECISELEARRMWPTSDADGCDHDASALREAYKLGREHEPTDAEVTAAAIVGQGIEAEAHTSYGTPKPWNKIRPEKRERWMAIAKAMLDAARKAVSE